MWSIPFARDRGLCGQFASLDGKLLDEAIAGADGMPLIRNRCYEQVLQGLRGIHWTCLYEIRV